MGKTKELYNWITSQNVKLQSPIIQLFARPFAKPWIVIADFQEAQDIMLRRTKEFDRSNFFGDVFLGLLPENHVSMKTNETFKQHRRWLQDLMTPGFLYQVAAPQIYTAFVDLLKLWEEKSRLAKGRPFLASDDVRRAALDAVWASVFGTDPSNSTIRVQLQRCSSMKTLNLPSNADEVADFPGAPNPPAIQAIETLTDSLETSIKSPLPVIAHWFLRKMPSMRNAYAVKENFIKEEVERTKNRFMAKEGKDREVRCAMDDILRREMLLSKKEGRVPMFHSRAMYDEIFGFVVAAHDTTATTITWALKFLADNQDVQSRLRSEIRSALADVAAEKRNPTAQEITKMTIPYMDAVMEEIFRCSLTEAVVARTAVVDVEVLGHRIPKGMDVFFMGNGPSVFSPAFQIDDSLRSPSALAAKNRVGTWNPDDMADFKPERWLVEEDGKKVFDAAAGPLLTFGLGPRGCYGRRLAYLELKLVLLLITWNFELQKCPVELSGYAAIDKLTHSPQQCYVRLTKFQ
jgi:cytochrome P450